MIKYVVSDTFHPCGWGPDPVAESSRAALVAFVEELNRLRRLCGSPSLNDLVAHSADLPHPLARSTISDKLNARSLPDWDFVASFVTACRMHADEMGAGPPPDAVELARWDDRYLRLLRDLDHAGPDEHATTGGPSGGREAPVPRQLRSDSDRGDLRSVSLDRVAATKADPPSVRRRRFLTEVGDHAALIAVSIMFLLPIVFIVLTALMTDSQARTPDIWPHPFRWDNFLDVFSASRLLRYTFNTVATRPWRRSASSCHASHSPMRSRGCGGRPERLVPHHAIHDHAAGPGDDRPALHPVRPASGGSGTWSR